MYIMQREKEYQRINNNPYKNIIISTIVDLAILCIRNDQQLKTNRIIKCVFIEFNLINKIFMEELLFFQLCWF